MSDLTFLRELPSLRTGQTRALYTRDDHHIIVSTVEDVSAGMNEAQRAIVSLGNLAGALLGKHVHSTGEETMAFLADENGEVLDWEEIAMATGDGSRDDVLAQLAEDGSSK
jgi:hypothetical protein